MVGSSVVAAVSGLAALTTVVSIRPSAAPSVTRLAMPMPAISVAQTSETTTILRGVMRSAVSNAEFFIHTPPGSRALVAATEEKVHPDAGMPMPGIMLPTSDLTSGLRSLTLISVTDRQLLRREQCDHAVALVGDDD